jgi:hypothetical protein
MAQVDMTKSKRVDEHPSTTYADHPNGSCTRLSQEDLLYRIKKLKKISKA